MPIPHQFGDEKIWIFKRYVLSNFILTVGFAVSDQDSCKYEMFSTTLQQSWAFGQNFRIPEGGIVVDNRGGQHFEEGDDDLYN